jgi:hypothetical protein
MAVVESLHPLLDPVRIPVRRGQSHVEHGFRSLGLVGAGCVHRGGGEGACEWRRLFDERRDGRWNGNDFVLLDELPQAAQGIAEGLQQLVCGRVVSVQITQHCCCTAMRINLGGNLYELLLVAPEICISDFEQSVQGNVHHLFV